MVLNINGRSYGRAKATCRTKKLSYLTFDSDLVCQDSVIMPYKLLNRY